MNRNNTIGNMKYCVVGNIVMKRYDENGKEWYGTASFPGGRKVYISRRLWDTGVVVMGMNRHKSRYVTEIVPLGCIENIRPSRTFSPQIIEHMMNTWECPDMWWRYKEEDKISSEEYADILNKIKGGDLEAYEQYKRDVMWRFYGNGLD